jgi:hypothetical protein
VADFACGAGTDLPLDMDTAWDGAAARQAMFEWAGGDNLDSAKLRRGFLVYDRSAPDLRGSYHLPFCSVKSGTLTALASGCRASASRLEQMDNLPQAVHDKARGVLDGYFKKISAEKSDNAQALDGEYLAPADWLPIRLQTAAERAQAGAADPEELLRLVKQRAQDPRLFDEFPPVFFSGIVSTNALDSYSTRMHRSSLENFAADLTEGRVLLDSHDSSRLGIGYSLRGRYIAGGGNGVQRAQADFYSAPVDESSIAFIRKMGIGTARDLSAGFYGGQWKCDLCGNEMGRWNEDPEKRCLHWPGMEYDGQTATATIHNARLAETSAVYDGATPGSMILRARQMSEAGLIVPEMARLLEVQYRIKLLASQRSWPGMTPPKEETMADKPEGQAAPPSETPTDPGILQAFHRSIAAALAEVPLPPESRADEPATLIRRLGAELIELRPLRDKVATQETRIKELEPQAEDGKAFRADLRQAVEAEYVRALGPRAKVEVKAEVWDRASIALLKAEYEEYAGQAYRALGGGRTTVDVGDPDPARSSTNGFITPPAPPAAFRA